MIASAKRDGVHCIVSDQSPSTLDLKDLDNGDFAVVWGGVLSLHATRTFPDLDRSPAPRHRLGTGHLLYGRQPAELARLNTKGQLALGYDADFAIFAADDAYVVDVT